MPTVPGDPAVRQGPDHHRQDGVLLDLDAGVERGGVVARQDRHRALGDDRPGVDAAIDEVDRDPGQLAAVGQGLGRTVDTGERGQEGGVGIDDRSGESVEKV